MTETRWTMPPRRPANRAAPPPDSGRKIEDLALLAGVAALAVVIGLLVGPLLLDGFATAADTLREASDGCPYFEVCS